MLAKTIKYPAGTIHKISLLNIRMPISVMTIVRVISISNSDPDPPEKSTHRSGTFIFGQERFGWESVPVRNIGISLALRPLT